MTAGRWVCEGAPVWLSVAVCVSAVCVALHHCVSVELRDSHDVRVCTCMAVRQYVCECGVCVAVCHNVCVRLYGCLSLCVSVWCVCGYLSLCV